MRLLAVLGFLLVAADKPSFNRRTGLFEPPFSELARAVARGDQADIGRWAARLGPARLAQALRGPDRAQVLAALEATPLLPGGVGLLDAVAALVGVPDAAIAERAAHTLGRILDGTEPGRVEEWDVPGDIVARACQALTDAATAPGGATATRLGAIQALTDATVYCRLPATALLADPLPAIRRAALLAARPRDELAPSKLMAVLADPDPQVAAAAGVALCRHIAAGAAPPMGARPLGELASSAATPPEDVAEMKPCLGASPQKRE